MIAGFGIQFKYCKQTIDVDNANFGAVAVERKMTWTAGKLMFDRQIVE